MSGLGYDAIIFDFDGVLIDSEYVGNLHLAEYLTAAGSPISIEETLHRFMGLSGQAFIDAIEAWRESPLPADFAAVRAQEDERLLKEGIAALAGAVDFVRALPEALPKAIASSSRSRWIRAHLDHLGLRARFEPMIFSGHEHVARGKPAPDLYLHAAGELGVDIERTVILEDSPVGITGALASGATVIGLCLGTHCAPDHAERLRALGARHVAASFDEVARLVGMDRTRTGG
ncbi:HAD family hydrolase [Sphingosinicella humi]|uniref:Haloacid dehalogenase n=1 Tax=Allosphingosinicella humi TaxID=2068657 RepID=A0A2U2J2E7_9SPHN|nr:HAD family phosphatase [Sphingosinicella humi]PWG02484.1 haloacid dehalogenase [Sphingosinicella humi]